MALAVALFPLALLLLVAAVAAPHAPPPPLPDDALLSRLDVASTNPDEKCQLDPAFKPTKFEYTMVVAPGAPVPMRVTIEAKAAVAEATIEVNGEGLSGPKSAPIRLAEQAAAVVVVTNNSTQQAYTVHLRKPGESPPPPPENGMEKWLDEAAQKPAFIASGAGIGSFVAVCLVLGGLLLARRRKRRKEGALQSSKRGELWKSQPFYSPATGPFMDGDDVLGSTPGYDPPPLDLHGHSSSAWESTIIGGGPNPFSDGGLAGDYNVRSGTGAGVAGRGGAVCDGPIRAAALADERASDLSRWMREADSSLPPSPKSSGSHAAIMKQQGTSGRTGVRRY